jgi:DNA topoisomerase-6 subunit B
LVLLTKLNNSLCSFLEFTCIDAALADRILAECGHGIASGADPKGLSDGQVMALHGMLRAAKFNPPSADCLSPAGEYNLRLGVMKELRPELVATYCGTGETGRDRERRLAKPCADCRLRVRVRAGPPGAHDGHPFMVEAAVSLGGRDVKQARTCIYAALRIAVCH